MASGTKTRTTQAVTDFPIVTGVGSAATYIGDNFDMRLNTRKGDPTLYQIYGKSYYDSQLDLRNQITSWTNFVGFGNLVPSSGDNSISLAGKDWNIVDRSDFPKSLTISDGAQTIVLEDGKRINLVNSTDVNKDWKVAFSNVSDPRGAIYGGTPGANSYVWIYNEDSWAGIKFKEGDNIPLPTYFGPKSKLTYDGEIDKTRFGVTLASLSPMTVKYVDSDGSTKTYSGRTIEMFTFGDKSLLAFDKSDHEYALDKLLLVPPTESSGGMVFYKLPNNDYFNVAEDFGLRSTANPSSTWAAYMKSGGNEGEAASLTFVEKARPKDGQVVRMELPIFDSGSSANYRFVPSGSETSMLYYTGLDQNRLAYEPYFISERGSKLEDLTVGNAYIEFSDQIVKAQWSVHDVGSPTGVREIGMPVPKDAHLKQNYPNPFNPVTTIPFVLDKEAHVSLKVYNLLGQEVATLTDDRHMAGAHEVRFDGSNLASGTYVYRLSVDGKMADAKILQLVK